MNIISSPKAVWSVSESTINFFNRANAFRVSRALAVSSGLGGQLEHCILESWPAGTRINPQPTLFFQNILSGRFKGGPRPGELKAINQGRVDPANYVWSKSGKGESWKMALRLRTGEINYSTFIMEGRKSAARLTGADRIVLGDVEEHIGKFAGAALGALFFKIFGAWGQELGGQELQSSSDRFISDLAQNWVRVDGFEAAELPDLFRYAIHLQQNILACGLTSGEVVPS